MDAARARKLADRIQQIVAEMLERRIKDPRLGFVTVTEARLTNDLREATVFYTVYGSDAERADTAAALHAGTLDPMATGVLVVGLEKATRLLGYLTLTEKEYAATIRLGESTSTDDAEGEITGGASAADVSAAVLTQHELTKAVAGLTGEI